jgi:diaminopimelate epimerase
MCGNGVRVFARYLAGAGLAAGTVPIETRAGVVRAVIGDETISVDMGLPKVYGDSSARLGPLELPGVAVDCGNPHLVCALPEGLPLESLDLHLAPGHDEEFYPAGVNVEFYVPVGELHVRMRVHERGSGETQSCGTGACAVMVAASLADEAPRGTAYTVDLPGGTLEIVWTEDDRILMTGPAVLTAEGITHL